jgi:hypothetical protein
MGLFRSAKRVISFQKTFKLLMTASIVTLFLKLSVLDEIVVPLKYFVATAGPNIIANQLSIFKYFSLQECPLVSPRLSK